MQLQTSKRTKDAVEDIIFPPITNLYTNDDTSDVLYEEAETDVIQPKMTENVRRKRKKSLKTTYHKIRLRYKSQKIVSQHCSRTKMKIRTAEQLMANRKTKLR